MNIYRTIAGVISLLLFVSLGSSCQPPNDVAQKEIDKKAMTPAPTPAKLSVRDDSKPLINDAGWELPDLSLFKEKSIERYKTNSIAKIEQKNYEPLSDVIQRADGNTSINVARDPDIEEKSWLIRYLKVFSADGQPFCFVMRGNWVEVDSNGTIKERLAMSIILIYSDQDGDGRFETFQYGSSEAPMIPERLKKR